MPYWAKRKRSTRTSMSRRLRSAQQRGPDLQSPVTPARGRRRIRSWNEPSPLQPTPPQPQTPTEVICLDDSVTGNILENVNNRVEKFMTAGGFISSDDEEPNLRASRRSKFINLLDDDSDEDCALVCTNSDMAKPSTSTGLAESETLTQSDGDNKDKSYSDYVVLDDQGSSDLASSDLNVKSLEDFRKETEEMLKSAATLLDEFKGGQKKEVEKVDESPQKVVINSCPICLESLADRPAAVTVCGHIFCKLCITQSAKVHKKCPTCRKSINTKKIHPIYF